MNEMLSGSLRFEMEEVSAGLCLDFTESVCGLCRKIRLTDFVAELQTDLNPGL